MKLNQSALCRQTFFSVCKTCLEYILQLLCCSNKQDIIAKSSSFLKCWEDKSSSHKWKYTEQIMNIISLKTLFKAEIFKTEFDLSRLV